MHALWTGLRSAFFAACFIALWMYYVPTWLVRQPDWRLPSQWTALPACGLALVITGAFVALSCVFDFTVKGKGTPAPFDPPRRLVRNRFYAHVRNPMYIGMGIAVFGEALVFPVQRVAMLWMLLGMFVAINIFILGYEEPTLTRLFGADYEAYKRNVPRWIPRLTPHRPAARTTHA